VKRADLPRITLHHARHSFATIALQQGVDVLYVSELLGHSSAAITQAVYQHSRPERVRDAVNTISKAIGVDREPMAHGGRRTPTSSNATPRLWHGTAGQKCRRRDLNPHAP
jgi:Phage integrase family